MKKRWYDMNPTVSMAVSLLQNAKPSHREKTISYINTIVKDLYPWVMNKIREQPGGFFALRMIQKRQSMDERSWSIIETLRYLPDVDKENLAVEIIRYIYCLENEEQEIPFTTMNNLGAAM